jgi:hypothetical protein
MRRLFLGCFAAWQGSRLPLAAIARLIVAYHLGLFLFDSTASAQILRVVTYNIDADTGGSGGQAGGPTSGPGLDVVLEAIGSHNLVGHAQPIDVLALQELYTTPSTTLSYIIGKLNTYYQTSCGGCAVYDYDTTTDATTGGTGGGPSGLIFNTKTVQKLGALQIGAASGSGAARAPMRYTLAPKGYNDHSADFYLYVSHMKSGSPTSGSPTNESRRNIEAGEIRDDANSLGINAHIIYSGDYNMNGSSEAGYQTMISSSLHSGIGKAIDMLNIANNWNTTSTYKSLFTESATFDQYRDDVQYVTGPVLTQSGLQLVPNTLNAFGNGGDIYHQPVTSSSNALKDLSNRSAALTALTTATDHLPVVGDYSFATAVGAPGDFNRSGIVDAADYTLWRSTYGATGSNLFADGNHNGVVDAADYVIWRRYRTGGPGAGSLASGFEVPEPAALMLMLGGCLAFISRSRLRG